MKFKNGFDNLLVSFSSNSYHRVQYWPWCCLVAVVESLSPVQLFVDLWMAAQQASLPFTISWSLLRFTSIEPLMISNHLILCRPLLLLPSIFPSIRVFSNESALSIRWPKYWSFSINPSNECLGLIAFRIDWFDLLAIQGTLKSLLQHHSSKASILWCSTLFMVQLSHPYLTTRKTIALSLQTFVGKVMSLLFNRFLIGFLSRFVIALPPRSKRLLIAWLQSLSTEILEPKKIKPVAVSIVSPSHSRMLVRIFDKRCFPLLASLFQFFFFIF